MNQHKNQFTEVKKEIEKFDADENKKKEKLQEYVEQKGKFHAHCTKLKNQIKENRKEFRKTEEEYGFLKDLEKIRQGGEAQAELDQQVQQQSQEA